MGRKKISAVVRTVHLIICPLSCTDGKKCTKMYSARAARFFPCLNTLSTWPWPYLVALFSRPMLFFILAISSSIFRTNRRISVHIFQSIAFHPRCFFVLAMSRFSCCFFTNKRANFLSVLPHFRSTALQWNVRTCVRMKSWNHFSSRHFSWAPKI